MGEVARVRGPAITRAYVSVLRKGLRYALWCKIRGMNHVSHPQRKLYKKSLCWLVKGHCGRPHLVLLAMLVAALGPVVQVAVDRPTA